MPDAIAKLDREDQAMFKRVFAGLFVRGQFVERVGRYELLGLIARGGMGVVYRAFDPELARNVAIKLIAPRPGWKAEELHERLQHEARLLARLDHPNVVTAYDVGIDEDRVFMAMALVEGVTLRERQLRGECSLRERLGLYIEAGRGLSAAHGAGVVHRDFKPDNVFVDATDRVLVGDFGLAQVAEASEPSQSAEQSSKPEQRIESAQPTLAARLTQTGDAHGTLGYMAPEQLRAAVVGPAADQYAFCVALWESICGQHPYPGRTTRACIDALDRPPRGLALIPWRLRGILLRGLAQDLADRHPSMDALVAALEREHTRTRRLVLGGALGLLGAAAVLASTYAYMGHLATLRRCADVYALDDLPEHPRWAELLERAGPELQQQFEALQRDGRAACKRDDPAGLQRALSLGQYVQLGLDGLDSPNFPLPTFVREFNQAFAYQPSLPMSPVVSEFVRVEVLPLEVEWQLGEMERVLDCALDGCETDEVLAPMSKPDTTELLLRRAHALLFAGKRDEAVADYRRAWTLARELPLDEPRELQAYIGLARTWIMRLGRDEAGGAVLEFALALPAMREASHDDPRLLELHELEATLARHRGELDRALTLQLGVLDNLDPKMARFERVPSFVNLGNIYRDRYEFEAARDAYQDALAIDPTEPEALLGLGLLLSQGQNLGEGRPYLDAVASLAGHERQCWGLIGLVELDLSQETRQLSENRRALARCLEGPLEPTPIQSFSGWLLVAVALASEAEFGSALDRALARVPPPSSPTDEAYQAGQILQIALLATAAENPRASALTQRARALIAALDPEQVPNGWLDALAQLPPAPDITPD